MRRGVNNCGAKISDLVKDWFHRRGLKLRFLLLIRHGVKQSKRCERKNSRCVCWEKV